MVCKIRLIIFFIIFLGLLALSVFNKGEIEVNLLNTLLPKQTVNSSEIIKITNKSSSLIKVVFETENEEILKETISAFKDGLNKDDFELNKNDFSNLLDLYLSCPQNFLSSNSRKLLKEKRYDEIYTNSIEKLYNPAGIQLASFEDDPYFLSDDFINSNRKDSEAAEFSNDKYYDFLTLKIKEKDALSPEISNIKIKKLINLQKKLSNNKSKIYLAGTPIHSYYASSNSIKDINIICILSTALIIFLTYKYFRNLKLLILIALSIMFGMLLGYSVTRLWFESFQIITMVFSTALIGIGVDYSYHYFFAQNKDKNFIKNLTFSFLTTVISFVLLYFTGIELLKQISIFTIFGLFGIYAAVLFVYPCFNLPLSKETFNLNPVFYKKALFIVCILGVFGLFRMHFDDSLNALYSPPNSLKKAEALFAAISGENKFNTRFIVVSGKNIEDIISKEEKIEKKLDKEEIDYISLSKLLPSINKQKENYLLVKDLYSKNLDKYSEFLTQTQIQKLKNKPFKPIYFNLEDYPYLKSFMLEDNKSLIAVIGDSDIKISDIKTVDIKKDIEQYLKKYRTILTLLFPAVLLILSGFLSLLYGFKNAVKILTPSFVGAIFALFYSSLIYGEINLFSIITLFLLIGFTIDYSIFRFNKEEKTESAIFVSCATTSFSFLLLSFSSFKLLSSISTMLFFGIIISYFTGFLLFKTEENSNGREWYQMKENSAGRKRLLVSWFLYKIFGKNILYIIAFFVAIFTFVFVPKLRGYSKKYFAISEKYTHIKPSLFNSFKHFLSYAYSLVDKILVYSGNYDVEKVVFENSEDKKTLFKDINNKKGVFFICNHIGNIEILQALLLKNSGLNVDINVVLSTKQSQIFNSFLKTVEINFPIKTYPVEDMGLETGIKIKESLDEGNFLFIAGDRLSENNDKKFIKAELFSKIIYLPKGTYKLAKLMDVPTYFISAVKIKNGYKIFLEKQNDFNEDNMAHKNAEFLKKMIHINPFQFFHFYDFFIDNQ